MWIGIGLPVVPALVAVALLTWGHTNLDVAGAAGEETDPQMSLGVEGAAVTCDGPEKPTACTVQFDPADSKASAFILTVSAGVIPPNGYSGFSVEIVGACSPELAGRSIPPGVVVPACPQGVLTWNPRKIDAQNDPDPEPQVIDPAPDPNDADSCRAEVVWPDLGDLCLATIGPAGQRRLGGVTSLFPPTKSNHVGRLIELDVHCPAQGEYEVVLTVAPAASFGATYVDVDGSPVLVKTVGERRLDLGGDGELLDYGIADALEINCRDTAGPPPTAGPSPTPAGTPIEGPPLTLTPTNGASPTPPGEPTPTGPSPTGPPLPQVAVGDVSCDGVADSLDAFLVLAFVAGLSHELPCGGAADADGDGVINTIDAQLILQLDAGLIDRLPLAAAEEGTTALHSAPFGRPASR